MKRTLSAVLAVITALLCFYVPASAAEYRRYGDVDDDGKISAADARKLLRISVSLEKAPSDQMFLCTADVDYDGQLTASDARLVLRASVGLEKLDSSVPHRHVWGGWTVREKATCSKEGRRCRTCLLNSAHVRWEAIAKKSHKLTKVTESLVSGGYIYRAPFYKCSVCGRLFTSQSADRELVPEKYIPDPIHISGNLKSRCDSVCRDYKATGVQIAVIKDGFVKYTYSYGTANKSTGRKVDEDTKYRVASLSKIATTIVFMALCDRGLVSETADISTYFGYKCYNPYYPNITITPRMILTHSATFVASSGNVLTKGMLARKGSYYNTKPGTVEQYSNFGFNVLANICERVTGKPFYQLAYEILFDPLKIDASFLACTLKDSGNLGGLYGPEGNLTPEEMLSYRPLEPGVGLAFAAGNLTISAKDYAKILAMIMNDGVTPDGKRILSSKSIEAMKTVRLYTSVYGLGYAMRRETTVFKNKVVYAHSGSAFGMFGGYVFCPDENAGVVVFTSGCGRSRNYSTELYSICHQLIQLTYPY